MATKRLAKEYKQLLADPVPLIAAAPLPSNLLEWHYCIEGPPASPYEGGQYHGKLIFPPQYPFKPPSIMMITPSGRFETNTRLCLSMSDFHPETWQPSWTVGSILKGLQSFMLESTPTAGSIETSEADKKKLAAASHAFNAKNKTFCDLFPSLVVQDPSSGTQSSSDAATGTTKSDPGDERDILSESPVPDAIAPRKVKPNEICPCGSKQKFKKCHGTRGRTTYTPDL